MTTLELRKALTAEFVGLVKGKHRYSIGVFTVERLRALLPPHKVMSLGEHTLFTCSLEDGAAVVVGRITQTEGDVESLVEAHLSVSEKKSEGSTAPADGGT